MTDDKFFSVPVTLSSGGKTRFTIRSVREAAWFLAEKWPRLEGSAFMPTAEPMPRPKAVKSASATRKGSRSIGYGIRFRLVFETKR